MEWQAETTQGNVQGWLELYEEHPGFQLPTAEDIVAVIFVYIFMSNTYTVKFFIYLFYKNLLAF
jgi:hypothetical protein